MKFTRKSLMKTVFVTLIIGMLLFTKELVAAADDLDNSSALPFRELSGVEMSKELGMGWNLGNTMDGHTGFTPNETIWQPTKTTKAMIKAVHDQGFNTIRIPVTWGTMIDNENGYSIDEQWMSRIQDIVDYAIEQDMYVIINIHHDGAEQTGWLRIATEDKGSLFRKFAGVWSNIAEEFKDYDEHVIFEAMNEVQGENMSLLEENEVIMELNQVFVNTVRNSGSNNEKRWLVVCGKYNYIHSLVSEEGGFSLPEDSVDDRLILSVHIYTPWTFCGAAISNGSEYSIEQIVSTNLSEISQLKTFTDQGIPVIVGEYGCINKDNSKYRALYLEAMNKLFRTHGLNGIYWDQGWYDRSLTPDYSFSIFDRETGLPIDKDVTDAMVRGYYGDVHKSLEEITIEPDLNKISEISLEQEINIEIGECMDLNTSVSPNDTNDVVLYKTDDPIIATVYQGRVQAKGIGTTTIIAFSQSGSAIAKSIVHVTSKTSEIPCERIASSVENLVMEKDSYQYLDATNATSGSDAFLYYRSQDDTVVTVSSIGKVVAVGVGETKIEICSSDGLIKTIPVSVSELNQKKEIRLSLNVYYNDDIKEYYGNEISTEVVTATGPGEYSLTFDCEKDLSETAVSAGVTTLRNLTAVYIKDLDVTNGETVNSPLESCDIQYLKILVDGQELSITNNQIKSALKDSGIFDTNDPLNAWDGSVVEEVHASNYRLNFTSITEPTKITVVFQLSNMKFFGQEETLQTETSEQEIAQVNHEVIEKQSVSVGVPICIVLIGWFVVLSMGVLYIRHQKKKK